MGERGLGEERGEARRSRSVADSSPTGRLARQLLTPPGIPGEPGGRSSYSSPPVPGQPLEWGLGVLGAGRRGLAWSGRAHNHMRPIQRWDPSLGPC